MLIREAQREVRTVFMGGFAGQLVSAALWATSAALATWSTPGRAIAVLVVGGMFIFPLTQWLLRALGRRASLGSANPMHQLAMQVAFTLPLNLPVAAAATLYRLEWFYPAVMVLLGTHYLPFAFLYGMWQFLVLGGVLVAAGLAIALYVPGTFALGGWVTAALLLVFAAVGRSATARSAGPVAAVPDRG